MKNSARSDTDASHATKSAAREEVAGLELAGAFSDALNRALDAIGYTAGHKRTAQIAADLAVSRSQAYRLLCGLSFPTTDKLAMLRRIGVSVDRLLDEIAQPAVQVGAHRILRLGDAEARCAFIEKADGRCAVAAIAQEDGSFRLVSMAPGEKPGAHRIALDSVAFMTRPSLAIIDDDSLTLSVLLPHLEQSFHVAGFASASAFKTYVHGIAGFDAFLIDWRLPDAAGDSLIREVRAVTQAPIFILTGDPSASQEIADALDSSNTHHVAKPADLVILRKRILACLGERHAPHARSR